MQLYWSLLEVIGHVYLVTAVMTFIVSSQVKPGLIALSQQILGPNTLVQGALPEILANTPPSFFENTMKIIQVSNVTVL